MTAAFALVLAFAAWVRTWRRDELRARTDAVARRLDDLDRRVRALERDRPGHPYRDT